MHFLTIIDIPKIELLFVKEINVQHPVKIRTEESLDARALVQHLWVVSDAAVWLELDFLGWRHVNLCLGLFSF